MHRLQTGPRGLVVFYAARKMIVKIKEFADHRSKSVSRGKVGKQMKIRKLTENDLGSLVQLYKAFWKNESNISKMRAKFTELQHDLRYIFLCATIDEVVVGAIMGIVCDEVYGDCRPFLVMEDLVVDRSYRQQGIGKALMDELEEIATERNCYQIQFITEVNRKDAVSFYESLGFNSTTHIGFKKSLK